MAKVAKLRRYLLYFGYIGTRFRGVVKELEKHAIGEDKSVVKYIILGLNKIQKIKPKLELIDALKKVSIQEKKSGQIEYPFNLCISSRTDVGVHTLCNSAHFDLELPDFKVFGSSKNKVVVNNETFIRYTLNDFFEEEGVQIRAHRVICVPSGFHSRFCALRRTYLYRIAVLDSGLVSTNPKLDYLTTPPVVENNRTHLVKNPFDVDKIRDACHLLEGFHDFSNFTRQTNQQGTTCRTLEEVQILPGMPLLDQKYDPFYEKMQFWDIKISSKAFLYHQIRRLVGALVGVGRGALSLGELRGMIEDPISNPWPEKKISNLPPSGLYLLNVEYPPEALIEDPVSKIESGKNFTAKCL